VGLARGNRGGAGWAVCSLRSIYLAFFRSVSISCLVLSILCVNRKYKMPPKPAMMDACWERPDKVNPGPSFLLQPPVSCVSHTQRNEAVKSICMPSSSSAPEGVADWDSSEEEEEELETVEGEEEEEEEEEEAESTGHERKVGLMSRRRSEAGGVGGGGGLRG